MSPDTSPKLRHRVMLRIQLGYPDLDSFVDRYARNVSRGGVFLPADPPLPAGTALRFEVVLREGQMALRGEGEVTWVMNAGNASLGTTNPGITSPGGEDRRALTGMAVRLSRLDERSRGVLERMVALKEAAQDRFFFVAPDPFAGPPPPAPPASAVAPPPSAVAPPPSAVAADPPRASVTDPGTRPRPPIVERPPIIESSNGVKSPEEAELMALLQRTEPQAAAPRPLSGTEASRQLEALLRGTGR